MQGSQALVSFVNEHADDDLAQLLLSAGRFPTIDVPFAVEQIRARRYIREKLPTWYADSSLLFPSKIAVEQCSSEQTAQYKQRLLCDEKSVCDLTGGLGVDTYFFAQKAENVHYVERTTACFNIAMYNFSQLQVKNIHGFNVDAESMLKTMQSVGIIYIDPSRRHEGNHRVFALSDCEPDLTKILPLILSKTPKVIAKLSPMLDIQHTLKLLPQTSEIHILSVSNECKELVFVNQRDNENRNPEIHCINFAADGTEQSFRFMLSDEKSTDCVLSASILTYLYEPNASILKAGAYKQVANRFEIKKIHQHSHLYTSDMLIPAFPGRIFQVQDVFPFSSKRCKIIRWTIPQANLSTRNFPLTVSELRQRTQIAEGGDCYLFATTLADNKKVLIQCRKLKITTSQNPPSPNSRSTS